MKALVINKHLVICILFAFSWYGCSAKPIESHRTVNNAKVDGEGNQKAIEGKPSEVAKDEGASSSSSDAMSDADISKLTEEFPFASVCKALEGAKSPNQTASEKTPASSLSLIKLGNDTFLSKNGSATLSLTQEGFCLDGLSIAAEAHFEKFANTLGSEMSKCWSQNGFFDRRNGECVATDELLLNCQFKDMRARLMSIAGIYELLTGHEKLGWKLEQCAFQGENPYLSMITLIKRQDKVTFVAKTAHLKTLSEVCAERTDGPCADAASHPNKRVLFVSAPKLVKSVDQSEIFGPEEP